MLRRANMSFKSSATSSTEGAPSGGKRVGFAKLRSAVKMSSPAKLPTPAELPAPSAAPHVPFRVGDDECTCTTKA